VNAKDLKPEDKIRKADGSSGKVEKASIEETTREMYNLTVADAHTYYVGDGQWLVHNACPPRIINKKFAGETYYPSNPLLRLKYPNGVQFNSSGFPDFSPYSVADVKIKLTGDYVDDFAAANEAAGINGKKPPRGYTWHHHQDMTTMQLVPADLHATVRHTGGMALLKQLLGLP